MFKWREWRGAKGESTIASALPGTFVDVLFEGAAAYERIPASLVDWTRSDRAPVLWRPAQD
jgi:hypothetical protein